MKTEFTPSFREEKYYWDQGIGHVMGIDEVGRGAFAGPIVIAGVIFHPDCLSYFTDTAHSLYDMLHTIHDSKKLKATSREVLSPLIQTHCLVFDIVSLSVDTVDSMGIGKANTLGMQQVVGNLAKKTSSPSLAVLSDGFPIPTIGYPQTTLIKGDQKSISIAAASIIAKVYRDSLMDNLAATYHEYGFEKHKGYGTKYHRDAIQMHGLSDIHRKSFYLEKYL